MDQTDRPEKLLVIGLDCAPPALVFDAFRDDIPNLAALMDSGMWGPLRSCNPPITVPAWAVMTTGKSPGRLGVYGFRNRVDYSYGRLAVADGTFIKEDRVWDILSRLDRKVVVLGVPQTYPPKWVNGSLVAGFLAPDTNSNYTFPIPLKMEIKNQVGEYLIDVKNFRTDDKDYLIKQINDMTDRRFALAQYLVKNKPWEFFMMVEMGPDRMHHGLWKHCDPKHPQHDPASPYKNALREYYMRLDKHIGALLDCVDRRKTAVMVVSDHGAKSMIGGVCINEWLMEQGYLVLKHKPVKQMKFDESLVDWPRTRAWASGGYYARVFINVEGREPQGIVPGSEYESFRDELAQRIKSIPDHTGRAMNTRADKPQDVYSQVRGVPPDLFVYFDDLNWRSVGSVGTGAIYTFENDTGPDDANHDWNGIFIASGPGIEKRGHTPQMSIIDVAPTMLSLLGAPAPQDMQGGSML
jgi:predicted AlkP superfamily phosphohydrolase/phosphomutase